MNAVEKKTLNIRKFGTPNPNLFDRLKAAFGNGLFVSSKSGYDWTAIYQYSKAGKEDLVNKGYASNVTVYSAITTISRVAAQAQWSVFKVKDVRKYEKYKAIQKQPYSLKQQQQMAMLKEQSLEAYDSHYLNSVFQHPNEQQSGSEYMENLIGFKLVTGDCYEYANMSDRKVIAELWPLPSHLTEIETDAYGTFPMRERGYKIQIGTNQIRYSTEEVCHSKYWSPYYNGDGSHLYGFSPLDAAWLAILQDNNAREAAVELLKNRGKRGVFMWENKHITEEGVMVSESNRFKEQWSQSDKEYKNRIPAMYGTGEFIEMGLGAKDLAILEICKMNKDDICNAYGISSLLLNNVDASTYDNYMTARKSLITNVVLPLLGTIRDSRNRKLKSDWNNTKEKIVCDFDQTIYTELDSDKKSIAEWMKKAGCFTDNEIRIQLSYEAIDTPYSNDVWKKTNDIPSSLINEGTYTKSNSTNGQETD